MIGWYAHHHGQGHVQRVQAVAQWIDEPPVVLSSAPRPAAWTGEWHHLTLDDPSGPGDDADAGGVLHWAPLGSAGLRERSAAVVAWVAAARPSLVVVDVSVEITLLVRLLGVPVAVVAMQGDRQDRPHLAAYDAATLLLAPWPEDADVGGQLDRWEAKTVHVGAFSRFDDRARPAASAVCDHRGPRNVLLLWGSGGSEMTSADLDAARAATPGWTWTVRAARDGTSTDVWPDLLAADVVVVHGGQNAVAEVAAARRPAVVVAQRRPHDEQEHRVRTLEAAGAAVGLERWPTADRWPALLDEARRVGADRWAWWAPGDGARRAATALQDLADGGRP